MGEGRGRDHHKERCRHSIWTRAISACISPPSPLSHSTVRVEAREQGREVLGPKIMFAKGDKQDPIRSGQTSLATAGRDFTKPVTLISGPVERGNAGAGKRFIWGNKMPTAGAAAGAAPPLLLISPWECPSLLTRALF